MYLAFLALVLGLVVLAWSADYFIEGAVESSAALRVPAFVVGMIVVGFGTSAPEMLVSAFAAMQENSGLALGNAYGSNTANIALILGLSAVLLPLSVQKGLLKRELPLLIAITLFSGYQLVDGQISRTDGVILLVLFVLTLIWSVWQNKTHASSEISLENEVESHSPLGISVFKLIAGLVLLLISSRILVWGAVEIASEFGVPDLFVGLTIVALGTSLPELAASIAAVRKKQHALVLGNIIGSNLFNTLAVVGIAAVIHPIDVAAEVLARDWLVMFVVTLLLLFFVWRPNLKMRAVTAQLNRWKGVLFIGLYFVYIGGLTYLAWTVQ